jgi:uncharacterized protein
MPSSACCGRGICWPPPAADTDQGLFSELSHADAYLPDGGLRLGAASSDLMSAWDALLPYLREALERLPRRLGFHQTPFCLFGAADGSAMAAVLGLDEQAPGMDWMAATVFHSILVFNLERCGRLIRTAGRRQLDAFVRQCTHEFVHLALRHSGIRVPVWLEEGFCELLSGAPLSPDALRYAASFQTAFCEFLREIESSPGGGHHINLLSFSAQPVDENPGYHLAHDLVQFLVREAGLDRLLDLFQEAGLEALLSPFPLPAGEGDLLARPLDAILKAWQEDLRKRVLPYGTPDSPLRVFVHGERAAIYNRLIGGVMTGDAGPNGSRDRNLSLEEGIRLWGTGLLEHPQFPSWQSGVPARRRALHLRLIVENACNLRCGYCYKPDFQSSPMTVETADRAIAVWRDLLEPGVLERSTVRLFGGEPLLNWNVVAHVLRSMESWEGTIAIVNTNGTLLKTEHVEAFRRLRERMNVALSVDGLKEAHDAARHDGVGRGSFDRVDAAARLLAEARVPLCLNAVVGRHNYRDLRALAEYVVSLRDRYRAPVSLGLELEITPQRPEGLVQLQASPTRGNGYFNGIVDACVQTVGYCLENGLPVVGTMLYPFDALLDPNGASGYFCAAAGAEMIVGAKGELLHCPAVNLPAFADLSQVAREGAIPDPLNWQERRAGNLTECRGCEVEGLCGGGCAAQSYASYGDVFATPEPLFCATMRSVFRKCLEHTLSSAQANA